MRGARVLLLMVSVTLAASPGYSMEFTLNGTVISASGEILQGDTAKFSAFLQAHKIVSDSMQSYGVRLSSPGGNLFEGMALGEAIRKAEISTIVTRDEFCASACALAFLGGVEPLATGYDVGRTLEFGASLGFHGFAVGAEKVSLQNETLQMSRIVTGLILSYAEEMRGVDLGWLSRTLDVSSSDLFLVKRPIDFIALSIALKGVPSTIPNDWYLNVCRDLVSQHAPQLDNLERVTSQSRVFQTIKALRQAIVAGRYGSDPIVSILEGAI